jgi:hypothetical protein
VLLVTSLVLYAFLKPDGHVGETPDTFFTCLPFLQVI